MEAPMAAFFHFVCARLTPGDRRPNQAGPGNVYVPAAEPFGRPPALRLRWHLDAAGRVASCWEQAGRGPRLIAPS
jgi:hypothetical protein